MLSQRAVKKFLKKKEKKINHKNLLLIKKYLEEIVQTFLKDIAKETELSGRKIIREEDIKTIFERKEVKYKKWEI